MHRNRYSWIALLLVAALGASPSSAQELRGRIVGVVTDDTGGALPGVTVTVSGPALIQPQTTVTGGDGSYVFPALPPGEYTLTYELASFRTLRREGLRVNLNVTVTADASMALAGMEETVTITGESPVVDIKSSAAGTNFTEELLQDIPNARDVWAAMAQAPGFQMLGYDVGGSHTGTQTAYQTYGFQGQNRTLLEGINVTEGTDANAGYFDFGSFEEFQVGGAGNMGEQHGLGAFLNVTVKSGGNEFHGDFYADYESDGTISDNLPDEFRESGGVRDGFNAPDGGLRRGNPITEQYDLNAGVGGPIVRDRAWFYGSYRQNNQYTSILGLDEEAQSKLENYTAKGTYQINSRNQIIGFYNRRSKLQPLRNLSLTTPVETAWYQNSVNRPIKVEWTSVVTDAAFLDVQFSHWGNYFPLYPSSTKSPSTQGVPVGRTDRGTGQQVGAQSYYHDRTTLKPQLSGSLSYYKDDWYGTHNFKFGTEIYRERREFLRFQPGDIYYWDRGSATEEVDIYNTPNTGINDTNLVGFYAQDSWTIGNRLTLNLGARFDSYDISWPDQSLSPNQRGFFQPVSAGATDVARLTSIGPRVGVAYDLFGDGKTVAKAFWGRFYFNPSTDIGSNENPVGQVALRYEFNDLNGNGILDPGPDGNLATSPELGDFVSSLGGAGFVRVDRDLEPAFGNEFSTHIEHEIMPNFSARGSYVFKNLQNGWGVVDVNRVHAYTIPFTFNDIGADDVAGTADDQVIHLFDRPADVPEDRVFTNPGRVGVDDFDGTYHTVEVGVNRRFTDKWLVLSSFEYTWANDFRRTTTSTSALAAARYDAMDLNTYEWQPNQRRFGKQDTTMWNYKLVGRYLFPREVGVSASYKLQSGLNVARRINVRLPNAGTERIMAEPLDSDRSDHVGILDLRGEKSFRFGTGRSRITGMIDVFNVLNSNPVVNFRTISGSRYKEVIALLDPRIVRFGVRFEF